MKFLYLLLLISFINIRSSLATIYYVTTNYAGGAGSFGDAIDQANNHPGKDSIYFNISGSSVAARTITLSSDSLLPNIKDTAVIDATTQPVGGHFGISTSKIQITSTNNASVGLVLDINAQSTEVYGLFISHFSNGIRILSDNFILGSINNGNVVAYCQDICIKISNVTDGTVVAAFVGVDTTGTIGTSANATGILFDNCKKITLGGKQQNSRNVISGCFIGIKISDSKYITIQGNYVGTDLYAMVAVPNSTGILASQTADGNTKNITIGGDSAKYVNVISGNLQRGLDLDFSSSFIQGNMIGTDLTGTLHIGNGSYGVYFRGGLASPSHDNVVGGIESGQGNVIAYNGEEGVVLQDAGAHNISIRGNRLYCNSQFGGTGGIAINGGNQGVIAPTLVIVAGDFVSGTTYPNALIDIYAADSCNTCEGSDYLATIIADSNGIFSTALNINAKVTVVANDTFGNSSAFSACADSSNTSCIFASFYKSKSKLCTGEPLALSDQTISVPGSTILSWQWLLGDGQVFNVQNPTVTFSQGGTFAITLIATNSEGCSDSTTDSITVKDGVVASFVADTAVCGGAPVNFSDNSLALGSSFIVQWFWDLGDGNNSTFTDFQHVYALPGLYTVTLTIINNNNCSGSFSDTVNVHAFPTPAFSTSPDVCAVTPIQFYDSTVASFDATITGWSWDFGDGDTSTDQNPAHLYTASGSYQVTLTVTDNIGCSGTTVQGITILAGAIANFSWTSIGLTVNFINTSSFNPEYSIQWTFGDGSSSSLQTPTHTYSSFGSYDVCLIVTDYTCNMSDTLCQTVLITGVQEISGDSKITVLPNPASYFITVSNVGSFNSIQLFNSLGAEVILPVLHPSSSHDVMISLPPMPEGVYWLQINTDEGRATRKVVISQN